MKRDFNAWLASLGDAAPVKIADRRSGRGTRHHAKAGTLKYGQSLLDASDEMDLEADRARYEADRAKDLRLSAEQGIDAALEAHRLDALLFPGSSGAALAARAWLSDRDGAVRAWCRTSRRRPSRTGSPRGRRPSASASPARACSEPRLLEIAYAFEQATRKRCGALVDALNRRTSLGLAASSRRHGAPSSDHEERLECYVRRVR